MSHLPAIPYPPFPSPHLLLSTSPLSLFLPLSISLTIFPPLASYTKLFKFSASNPPFPSLSLPLSTPPITIHSSFSFSEDLLTINISKYYPWYRMKEDFFICFVFWKTYASLLFEYLSEENRSQYERFLLSLAAWYFLLHFLSYFLFSSSAMHQLSRVSCASRLGRRHHVSSEQMCRFSAAETTWVLSGWVRELFALLLIVFSLTLREVLTIGQVTIISAFCTTQMVWLVNSMKRLMFLKVVGCGQVLISM